MMADREVDDALAGSFLAELPAEVVSELIAAGERADYPAGSTVYLPGSEPQTSLVVRGLLRNFLGVAGGPSGHLPIHPARRRAGHSGAGGRPGQRRGPGGGTVQPVPDQRTHADRGRPPRSRVSWAIAEFVTRRLYENLEQTAVNAFGSVRQRVAAHLLDLASTRQEPAGRLAARVSQQELADAAGSVRDVVARVLRELRTAGIIATAVDHIVILDATRLYAESAGSARA
jgi:CRP/FNR family cyclic AMP-dependent transcriptional regulator